MISALVIPLTILYLTLRKNSRSSKDTHNNAINTWYHNCL